MPWDAQSVIQVITALTSFVTVVGGVWIAIKQAGISKKVDAVSTATTATAQKITENAETRAAQMADLKQTIVQTKGNGT